MKEFLTDGAALTRVMSLTVAAWLILFTAKIQSNIQGLMKLSSDSHLSADSFLLGLPLWVYWLSALLISVALFLKDRLIRQPFPRFLINLAALWLAGYVCSSVVSAASDSAFDFLKVVQ